jgi:hypothetical protein
MKKGLLRLCAIGALFFASQTVASAQSITIGNNQFPTIFTNNNDYGPIRNLPTSAAAGRWAYIYAGSLFSIMPVGSQVSSLAFYRRGAGLVMDTSFNANLKIYIKNTPIDTFPAGAINWVDSAATALKVFDGNPAQYLGSLEGFVTFPLDTAFTHGGGNVVVFVQYTQSTSGAGIPFGYDNAASVPAYLNNTTKYVLATVDTFASGLTSLSNQRKPTIRFNFPSATNIGRGVNRAQQFGNLGDVIYPSLTIINSGLQNATNITVVANGPAGYVSSRVIASLNKDSIALVTFDSLMFNNVGSFNLEYIITTANDGNALDDTLRVPIQVQDPNVAPGVFSNGPIITHPGAGYNGFNLSQLTPPLSTLGSNASANFKIVEDFILPGTSNYTVDSLAFWAYQTGSGQAPSFTALFATIWDGDPGKGGTQIYGDELENIVDNLYFSGIYRASANTPLDSTRPLMKLIGVYFTPVVLRGGVRYFIEWNFAGSIASGPWQSAIAVNGLQITGNGQQKTSTGYQAMDGGGSGFQQGAPFEVHFRVNTTSVDEINTQTAFIGRPYPNPASESAAIRIELKRDETVSIELLDITGKMAFSTASLKYEAGKHTLQLPVNNLQAGLYLIKIKHGHSVVHRKLQVIK